VIAMADRETIPVQLFFTVLIMPTNLIVAFTLAGGAIALLTFSEWRLWRRRQRSNGNCVPMPPPTPMVDSPRPWRYSLVVSNGEAFMMPSPNGEWVRWQDVAKPQPTGGRLVQEPQP
jgi:hypothetical protein